MNKSRKLKRIYTVGLTTTLAVGLGVGTVMISTPDTESLKAEEATSEAVETTTTAEETSVTPSGELFKDEAVYVLADPAGAITDITVADWLKNAAGLKSVTDRSYLSDIVNVKGDETFAQDDKTLTWSVGNDDIYYQGKTEEKLPVDVAITYTLDGKEMEASELLGKSGKLEMHIKYTNNSKETVKVNGEDTELFTPFALATAVLLPIENFKNVEVDHGKLMSDGDKTICIGYGFPGLAESLQLSDSLDIELPEEVTITADVTNFEMNSTVTYASSNLLSDFSKDEVDSLDDLEEKLGDLTDASTKLVDGTVDLADGVNTLKGKAKEFTDGIGTLVDGLKEFQAATDKLKSGIKDYTDGVTSLTNGVTQYVDGTTTLANGVIQYTAGTQQLVDGVNQLGTSVAQLPDKLTQLSNGYTQVMNGLSQLASKENTDALANGAAALSGGITTVNGGLTQVQSGITDINTNLAALEASFKNNQDIIDGLNKTIATMESGAAKSTLEATVAKLETVTATQKSTITALKNATAKNQTLAKGVDTLVAATGSKSDLKTGAEKLKAGANAFNTNAGKLQAAMPALQSGTKQLSDATKALPSALKQLNDGGKKLSTSGKQLNDGAKQLKTKGVELKAGASKLSSATKTLTSGFDKVTDAITSLVNGGNKLVKAGTLLNNGISDLHDGSIKLRDNLKKFDKEGIQELNKKYENDFKNSLDRAQALKDLGDQYESFSGKDDSMKGSVKFIIKTDEVKASEE